MNREEDSVADYHFIKPGELYYAPGMKETFLILSASVMFGLRNKRVFDLVFPGKLNKKGFEKLT